MKNPIGKNICWANTICQLINNGLEPLKRYILTHECNNDNCIICMMRAPIEELNKGKRKKVSVVKTIGQKINNINTNFQINNQNDTTPIYIIMQIKQLTPIL